MRRSSAVAVAAFVIWALFALLAWQVASRGPAVGLDAAVLAGSIAYRGDVSTRTALWVSETGGPSITSVYAAVLVVAFLLGRRVREALAVASIVYGGIALNVALKHAFHRGRPVLEDPLVHLITYSFPSGHAAAATVFGGMLFILSSRVPAGGIRAVLRAIVVAWIIAVCCSRVYLGAHYVTDVMGGMLAGTGWLLVCSMVLRHWNAAPALGLR